MTSLRRSGGSGDSNGGSSGNGGDRTSSRCGAVRWGVSCGGQMELQRRPRESLPTQQLREWYASRSGGGGSSGSHCAAVQLGVSSGGLAQLQRRPRETLTPQQLREWYAQHGASRSRARCPYVIRTDWLTPHGGPVLAHSSTVLPCPAVPSGSLSGLHLPSFSTNLVSTAALQDVMVTTTTSGGQRVSICTCTRTGLHLATFTRQPGSSLYTLATEPPQVAASAQVSASGQVAPPYSCCLLSHQTLLWHHRLGHPSLPRLRGMHSRLLVSSLPRFLPPLPPSPAPPCLPCVEGRQRAAPHSSLFPPTSPPLQTLHMDVWGPARVSGQVRECYFLLVVDDYTRYTTVFPLRSKGEVPDVLSPWIHTVRLLLCERFHEDLPVLRLHSDRGGEFSSDLLREFCRGEAILQSFTLPASPQRNGIAERHIGLVMEVARTSMIHVAAPHFLWPFAVRYAAHQLNLWPCVSLPETSPALHWTGEVGVASVFRVWGSRAFVRDTSADKLCACAIPCGFLGFPHDAPGWQFYHPTSSRVIPSQVVTFDVSVPFYRLSPYCSAPPPPPPLFLARDTLPGTMPDETAISSGAARGAASGGAASGSAEPGGAESEGARSGGAEPGGAELGGSGGTEPLGTASSGGPAVSAARDTGAGGDGVTAGAGGTGGAAATGPGGARTRGTGAAGIGSAGGAGAGDPEEPGGTGTSGAGAGGAGAGDTGALGKGASGASAGGARAGDTGTVDPGAGGAGVGDDVSSGTGAGGTLQPRPYFVPLLQQVLGLTSSTGLTPPLLCPLPDKSQPPLQLASPLPAPSSYTERTGGLTERCEPESRQALPIRAVRTGRRFPCPRPPPVRDTNAMALRPSSVPLRVPLLPPPESSLPAVPDPESDLALAASPTSTSPPSVKGDCALGTHVLEDRQEDLECLAAAVPRFASMLLAPEGDPDAPDISTPCSYAEEIMGPYSSQWKAAMDAEMASWKSTDTYVDEFPKSRANIVDGMWILGGVDYFQTFSPTPRMTTLWVLLHVASQRDYKLHSLDLSTTFLQGSLHEEIWLHRPPGFTGSFPAGTQWSLRRPVYSLRQAPREWHDTLRTTLVALGFTPSTVDPSQFLRTDMSLPPFYVLVYVDDLVFAIADTEAPTLVKSELQKRHTCTDLGEQRSYLGLQFTRDRARRTITRTQSDMVHQVLQHFDFQFSSPQPTPLSTSHSLSAPPSDESPPGLLHGSRTLGMGLVLGGWGPVVLTGHADASWELRWLAYLLTDLGEQPRSPPALYVDNKAMIALCQEHKLERIALRYFLALELLQRGQLRLAYVATRANSIRLMAKGIHLEAESTIQEFKLYHGKGRLFIGKAFLKNNVFVLDFVPNQGAADSDAIVNFTTWTHPPDLDVDFSPGGFCRDMAFEAFIEWLPVAERESGVKLKSFQSDGGGEYQSQRFKQYMAGRGIKRLISLPYAHQQKGVAERMNRTLKNTMRKLPRGMRLPSSQRPEAMDHTLLLHNLLSSSSLPNNASPHLLWTGKLGNTKMLRVFGCMVQYRPHTARAGRFSQRAQWGLHLGIKKHHNAWKIFDVHSKETVAARGVLFYERLTLQTYLDNLAAERDLTGSFRGNRAFATPGDEAD
ncbi:unnamed protein product [Closterium sp. NIES-53]